MGFELDFARFSSAEFRNEFIARLYNGDNLLEACAFMKVNPASMGLYRRDSIEFDVAIRQAQAFRMEIDTERLSNIDQEFDDAMMASVVSKNIQWLASKRARQIYGEKLDVNVQHTVNIREAMNDAQTRVIEHVSDKQLIALNSYTDNISVEHVPAGEIDPLS